MWTAESLETARKLWIEGRSASEVAREVGAVSRSAVIGQVHRRGWQRRIDSQSNGVGRTERVRHKRAVRRSQPPRVKPARKEALPADLAAIRTIPMSDVLLCEASPSMCKFMAGDPAHDPRVCGRGTLRDRVYCADHAALCYVAPDPKKKPRARA